MPPKALLHSTLAEWKCGCEIAIALSSPRPFSAATVSSSTRLTQSHSTLPAGVSISSARCPMAKLGSTPMARTPSSSFSTTLWSPASSSIVVQPCPAQRTYCRSSSQTTQDLGGASLAAYWTPHCTHMKWVMKASDRGSRVPAIGGFRQPLLLERLEPLRRLAETHQVDEVGTVAEGIAALRTLGERDHIVIGI